MRVSCDQRHSGTAIAHGQFTTVNEHRPFRRRLCQDPDGPFFNGKPFSPSRYPGPGNPGFLLFRFEPRSRCDGRSYFLRGALFSVTCLFCGGCFFILFDIAERRFFRSQSKARTRWSGWPLLVLLTSFPCGGFFNHTINALCAGIIFPRPCAFDCRTACSISPHIDGFGDAQTPRKKWFVLLYTSSNNTTERESTL